jgi:hypothetical protein
MKGIPAIDDTERQVVESALRERYGQRIETEPAEVELKLAPQDGHLTTCPTLYWEARGAAFVISKVANGRYRTMFYYPADFDPEQYGTGRPEYDDLFECVTTVLRLQADHEKERHGVSSGKTARDLQGFGEHDLDDGGPEGAQA